MIGALLEGRFRIEGLLGRGGMGNVYAAEEIHLKRRCALKVLRPELAEQQEYVERFLREARTIAQLSHENIVDIYSYGMDPSGTVFFALELLVGEDLETRLKFRKTRPFAWRDVCTWGVQIARAVSVVHNAGLIHRDLKPANIFLARRRDGDGEIVKLLDFGVVRNDDDQGLTRVGTMIGTPHYMSPEQVQARPIDARSDIYSFGVVLFKLLTGAFPFHGEMFQVGWQHVNVDPPSFLRVAPNCRVPAALEALVRRMLAKHPEERIQSMAAVGQALRAIHNEEATVARARPPGPCPGEDTIVAFAEGLLSRGELAEIEAHIDVCPDCAVLASEAAHDLEPALPAAAPAASAQPITMSGEILLEGGEPATVYTGPAPAQPITMSGEILLEGGEASTVSTGPVSAAPVPAASGPPLPVSPAPMPAGPLPVAAVPRPLDVGRPNVGEPNAPDTGPTPTVSNVDSGRSGASLDGATIVSDGQGASRSSRKRWWVVLGAGAAVLALASQLWTGGRDAALPQPSDPIPSPAPEPVQSMRATDPPALIPAPASADPSPPPTEPAVPAPVEDLQMPDIRETKRTTGAAPTDPIQQIKRRAKSCRRQHHAISGPKILIDYAIDTTGKVSRSVPAETSALGQCLAGAVKHAQFPARLKLGQQISL